MSRLFAAALALAVATAAPCAHAACALEKQLTLPVTMVGTRPSVEVRLGGKPVRLEVDSGAFFSTLSPAATAQLGLKTYPAPFGMHVMGVNGEATKIDLTKASFGMGKAEFPDVEFLVGGGTLQGEMGIIGLMGRNVLTMRDMDYDFAHGELNFIQPRNCGAQNLGYWSPSANVLPMSPISDPRRRPATAYVKVNGADLKALFDTGAGASGLTLAGARKAKLDVRGPNAVPAGYSTGIGSRRLQSWLLPVTEIRIGDETVKNTKIRVSDWSLSDYDMLIGADFFLSHRVYIANSQSKIYFTYNGGPVFDLSIKPGGAPPPEPITVAAAPGMAADGSQAASAAPPAGAGTAPAPALAADEPKDADGYSRRGQAYVARRDYAHALADLSRAVELDPQNARYLRERAQLRLITRQPFLAMTDLDAELKLTPDDAEAHLMRARLRASGRDRTGEAADLDAADRTAPKQADIRLAMAAMFTGLDQYDRAVAQYDQWLPAHEGDSRRPSALNGRCWTRAQAGRDLDKALADCDAALRLEPKTPNFLDSRGLVHLRRGELDPALADYDAALAAQPKLAWALYGRGVVKARKGDAAGGQADLAAAAAANAQVPEQAKRVGVVP